MTKTNIVSKAVVAGKLHLSAEEMFQLTLRQASLHLTGTLDSRVINKVIVHQEFFNALAEARASETLTVDQKKIYTFHLDLFCPTAFR